MGTAWQGALLEWSIGSLRNLPWRHSRDPWAIVVSELMLQQTQVSRVLARYGAFLQRFPTPAACAAAPLADVVREWAGLGYNRRAVNLHRMATVVVERHGGRLPADLVSLLELPGVGTYTARAVMAFAFEADAGVVDVNAARVLARTAGRPLTARQVQGAADAALPAGRAWTWNQAVLDLGATVCTKRSPRCDGCPIAAWCEWRRRGGPDPAEGSAGTTRRQRSFAGSDRQGRGRLVSALRRHPVPWDDVAATAGWPDDPGRAGRVAAGLVADGLADDDGAVLRLPDQAPPVEPRSPLPEPSTNRTPRCDVGH